MVRYGSFTVKDKSDLDTLNFIWTDDSPIFESLDMIYNLSEYNPLDTRNCQACFYRKSKDLYYGNLDLIKKFMRCKSQAILSNGKKDSKFNIVDGKAIIQQTKTNEQIGISYEIETVNGLLNSERYETPEAVITVHDVSLTKSGYIQPINLSLYESEEITEIVVSDSSSDADYYSLEYLRSKYPWIDDLDTSDYVIPHSIEEGRKRLKEWAESPNKEKGADIEGTGLDVFMHGRDILTGIVLASSETNSTYFCFRQEKAKYNFPISFIEEIVEVLNSQPDDVVIVWHGARYDIQGFRKEFVHYVQDSEYWSFWKEKYDKYPDDRCAMGTKLLEPRCDRDSLVLSIMVNPVIGKGLHTLKALSFRATRRRFLELDMIFKGVIRFNALPEEYILLYACPDPCNTIAVYKWLLPQLPKMEMNLYKEVECPLVEVKAQQEFYGLRSDRTKLEAEIQKKDYQLKELGDYFRKFHKTSQNLNSPAVLREILYCQLRAPIEVRTEIGAPSTSKIAIKRICDLGAIKPKENAVAPPAIKGLKGEEVIKGLDLISNRYPSLVVLTKYNEVKKELGALKRLVKHSHNGRIIFYINQNGAASGRQTSDAHQFSDGMKGVVISDSPDHILSSCDYKQVELRVLAYLSGQLDLIELMKSSSLLDIHRAILSIINHDPIWAIDEKMRKLGKATNFGVVYMMSGYGLARRRVGPGYTSEDLVDATNSITDFYNGLPKIKAFVAKNEESVRRDGYITTRFGRYRYFKEILDEDTEPRKVSSMIRAANNTPVQGFAADMLKIGEVAVLRYIRSKGWDEIIECSNGEWLPKVRDMLPIHDEILTSHHKSIPAPEIIKMLKTCMEVEIPGAPPFYAAPAFVNCWFDGKNDAYEIPIPFRDEIIEAWDTEHKNILDMDKYLECLNTYRNKDLARYMEPLIAEYKTWEQVSEHVRDDIYTHILISTFKTEDDDKKLTQVELIELCTKRYMEYDGREINAVYTTGDESTEERLESFEQLEEYIQIDANGEAIIDEDEEDDSGATDVYDEAGAERRRIEAEGLIEYECYCYYLMSECWIDLSSFGMTEWGEEANQRLHLLADPDGEYDVVYLLGNKYVKADFKVKSIADKINDCIKGIRSEMM